MLLCNALCYFEVICLWFYLSIKLSFQKAGTVFIFVSWCLVWHIVLLNKYLMNEITDKQPYREYSNSNGKIQQEHNRSPQCVKECNVDKSTFILCGYNNKNGKSSYTKCGSGIGWWDRTVQIGNRLFWKGGTPLHSMGSWLVTGHETPNLLLRVKLDNFKNFLLVLWLDL